jgi:ABC-type multidrug transport system fused ATPase/permease subunit
LTAQGSQAELQTPYWRLEDTEQTRPGFWSLLKRLASAAQPVVHILRQAAPRSSWIVFLAQLCSGLVTAGSLLLTTGVLNQLLADGPNPERLRAALPAMLLLGGLFVVRMALDAAASIAKAHVAPKVRRMAEEELYRISLDVDLVAFDDAGFYDQLHRARDRGVLHIEGAVLSLVELCGATFAVLGAGIALLLLHPMLLGILLLALLPEALAVLAAARIQYAGMPLTVALTRQTQMMTELATQRESAAEIRVNQAQDYVLAEYRRYSTSLQNHMVSLGLAEARSTVLGRALSGLGLLTTFIALGLMLYAQWLNLAVAGTAIIAIRSASAALARLMLIANELFQKGLYISDYREFIDRSQHRIRATSGVDAPENPGRIDLNGVCFHYPDSRGRMALRDISLSIDAGQTIALVGENGSGKTTLAKLIAGLYQPTSGRIAWNHTDLREMAPRGIADRVAMVPQEPIRWPRSARENIRLGRHTRTDPGDQALLDAAKQSRAIDIIEDLPDGWQTLLSREFCGGQDLSNGQWQRLAVARGLFRDAPLVIWDEPTSALDAKAEQAVYESLRQIAQGRTVILITHRLASVRNVDKIFFLERGALTEQGRHEELLHANGRYAELYRLQTRLHDLQTTADA